MANQTPDPSPAPVPAVRAIGTASDPRPAARPAAPPAPAPAEPRSPWNPPGRAKTFTLNRRAAGAPSGVDTNGNEAPGSWEPCTVTDGAGQVHRRHEAPAPREVIVAAWGGGAYRCVFFDEQGNACGQARFELLGEARPAAASAATVAARPEQAPAEAPHTIHVPGEPSTYDEEDGDPEDDDDEDDEDDDEDDDEARALRAELDETREELARMARVVEQLRGSSRLEALTMPKLPPREPRPPIRVGSPKVARALEEYRAMRAEAEADADRRIERMMAMEEMRRREEDARHARNMAEQSAWFERALTFERAFTARAEKQAKKATKGLRRRVEELEDQPATKPAGALEKAFAESLPKLADGVKEIGTAVVAAKLGGTK